MKFRHTLKHIIYATSLILLISSLLSVSVFALAETIEWGELIFSEDIEVGERSYVYSNVGYTYKNAHSYLEDASFKTTIKRKALIGWKTIGTYNGVMDKSTYYGKVVDDCNSGDQKFKFVLSPVDNVVTISSSKIIYYIYIDMFRTTSNDT